MSIHLYLVMCLDLLPPLLRRGIPLPNCPWRSAGATLAANYRALLPNARRGCEEHARTYKQLPSGFRVSGRQR